MKIFSIKNKTAIVTGALGLIGREHCKALSEAGANVIVADINEKNCEEFAKTLETESIGIEIDVTNKESLEKARDKIIEKFGHIDILVNNAAINDMFENPKAAAEQSKFENYPLELWQKSVDVNLTGVFLCSQVFGTEMAKQKSGSIINIASTYGITAPDQSLYIKKDGTQDFFKPPAYSATKGGVIAFTKYLAAYWGKDNVRVNTLTPGGVENNQDEFFVEQYSKRTMLNRMAKPTDYKGALIFLASDASSYMTGANLVVDGGWTAW
ncbi:MAG: SDR family oxidoreductase [Melioribacteraceae bacterium]|nr:SDR family oxidoreductase [Melioribacteraceae bacterium]